MYTYKLIPTFGLTLAALLATASVGHAQSVLLSASDFTLLGGTAITSTGVVGTRIINGNVGLSPGATTGITGFPPAVIENGAIIATGPVTGQARLDLIKVSAALALMPSDANLSNLNLAGMTLTPGVYTFDGSAALTGALTLDAEGQDNAFWVFQISTDLNTSLNSTVTLINPGADDGAGYGLFWNAGGAVNIGAGNNIAGNNIAGNYIAGTSIIFGGAASGGGRALALAGVTLDTTVINAFGGPAGGDWTGGLEYNQNGQIVPVSAIPEPSTSATLAGVAILGFVALRRRGAVNRG